jgi:hypothetical protein
MAAISHPFRANHFIGCFPGLKPWAESYRPSGAKTSDGASPYHDMPRRSIRLLCGLSEVAQRPDPRHEKVRAAAHLDELRHARKPTS